MAVTDQQVATLRAQLAGDLEEHQRLLGQLDATAASTGYSALVSAAFCEAVERRFPISTKVEDVIRFVGDVRARVSSAADKIEPRTAERVILAVFTDEQVDDVPTATSFQTQLLLLAALIADEQFDDADLDAFLGGARKLANAWLA